MSELQRIYIEVSDAVSPIYMVGGTVRDLLLRREPKDFDFATPLNVDQIEQALKEHGYKVFKIGKKFGTIGTKINSQEIHITTFRTEEYVDSKRFPKVSFVSKLEEDLSRRDFTINAMAIRNSQVIDLFDGQLDLKNKIIKAVGDPSDRFEEDPLRILRALRFNAELGFQIETQTLNELMNKASLVNRISKERIMSELNKIFVSEGATIGLKKLIDTKVLLYLFPEIYFSLTNNKLSLESLLIDFNKIDLTIASKWAILLGSVGILAAESGNSDHFVNEIINRVGLYMKWSNIFLNEVLSMHNFYAVNGIN